jgi:hypothetical protein
VTTTVRAGSEIDGFRIEAPLHEGGMAVLHAVGGRDAGFPLLMKVPRIGHGEPVTNVISYEIEATILAALRGPHVPRFVAAGDLARAPYIVMERVEGSSLREWIERAPLPIGEVARLGASLAAALGDLHRQEVVHLDVNPSNVIVRPSGQAVLVDFGLAFHAHYPDLLAEEFRRPIGTAAYMAPEQVLGDRSDPRSDVFALGAVLYQLATGSLPFGSPASQRGLRKRLWRDPVPPRALVPGIPEWLQEVILHCLEPQVDERYATAAQVALDLAAPEAVAVTERGRRLRRSGSWTALRRRIEALGREREGPPARARLARAPIVLAAVATVRPDEARFEALRDGVRRFLAAGGDVRLACVTIIPPSAGLAGSDEDTATRRRISHLVLLRHWAEPLRLAPGRLSTHVLEASDPADALVEWARANAVDHVIIGGPPPGIPQGALDATVSMRVAAEAPCTVTIVRPLGLR